VASSSSSSSSSSSGGGTRGNTIETSKTKMAAVNTNKTVWCQWQEEAEWARMRKATRVVEVKKDMNE
jgi:hypothetical protein